MSDVIILTNPDTKEVWRSDNRGRGRTKKWVTEMLKAKNIVVASKVSKDEKDSISTIRNGLRIYKWVGQEDVPAQEQCVIIAHDVHEALSIANKTFKSPIYMSEMNSMWKDLEGKEFETYQKSVFINADVPGIWHVNNGRWEQRKNI